MKKPVVIITGAAGGIGRACVAAFLRSGARVVMADVKNTSHPRATFIATDISDEASVEHLMLATVKRFGRIDVLVNNAAVLLPTRPVHQTTLKEFDKVFAVNLRGTFLCCKHAHQHLLRRCGCIINISSMAGVLGEKNHAAYAATKGAVNALTKAMAVDYAGEGIRVNAVCPAGVGTPASVAAIAAMPNGAKMLKSRNGIHALGRVATSAEVASVVVFLASAAASFITGALVPISGGAECGYGIK